MVSFSDIEYQVAFKKGNEQSNLIADLIKQHGINARTPMHKIDSMIDLEFGEQMRKN